MGNKILTQYDVNKEPCYYSAELKWRLHSASFKEKPDEKLTIFLFERKVIEKYAKNAKEQILDVLKKDATCLQRLRHPHILSVLEALTEERSTLAFATKPVVGTVSQLLENNRHELSNLEMKCGLLDVAEAMQFLHQDAKTAHLGLSPHAIFIDPQGKWLLGSLGHSISGVQWGQLIDCPFGFNSGEAPGNLSFEPPARYAAPEMCALPAKCGLESDMFAMGLLTYELMCIDRQPLLRAAPRGFSTNLIRAGTVPADLFTVLQKILSPNPAERPTIAAFINSEFFMDVNVRAIRFLEQLNEKEEVQRVTFLRGLPKLLQDEKSPLCSQRVMRERVLPRLCSALLFPSLYGVVVPIIFSLLQHEKRVTDPMHFQAKIWPSVRPLFTAKEIPIEVVILFLKELDLMVTLAPPADTQAVLLPFLLRCLELQEPTILNEVLEKVPFLHKKFEYRQVKDQVLPRMLQLLLTSPAYKVKVQVLMGLSRIFEIFDKNTIQDVMLPAFEKLTKSDRNPAICMCLLGCYDAMSKHLGHKITSERILPLIMPLLTEDSLSLEQWETQLTVAKKLMQRVETARRKEFETKQASQAESEHALGAAPQKATPAAPVKEEPQDFESLLMGAPAKASVAKAPSVPYVPVSAPPPPASGGFDFLSDKPTPSAPSAMGNFDPFASSQANSQPVQGGSYDPFASMASSQPAPSGGFGSGNLGMMGGCGGMSGGMNQGMQGTMPGNMGGGMCGGMGGNMGGMGGNMGGMGGNMGGMGGNNMGGYPAGNNMGGYPAGNNAGPGGYLAGPGGQPALPAPQGALGGMKNLNFDPFAECQ